VRITPPRKLLSPTCFCALVVSAAALMLAPGATPAPPPLLTLGPITIADGTATLAGTIGPQVTGATLTVNGQPLGVDAAGHFTAVVDLNGAAVLDIRITRPADAGFIGFRIPLTGLGVIPGSVIDALVNAGLSVLPPISKGGTVTVTGSVLDLSQLATLTVNGMDVLRLLRNGSTFTVQLPGTTKIVTVLATDPKGVSQTIGLAVGPATVAAGNAAGLRIAKIRYVKKGVLRTHRVRLIVTVKDTRGLLVKGATIVVRAKGHRLAKRPRTVHSGVKGRATIALRLRPSAFGKRLVTITAARTPNAKARKRTATLVPRARPGSRR
jgi:hypothetical protein